MNFSTMAPQPCFCLSSLFFGYFLNLPFHFCISLRFSVQRVDPIISLSPDPDEVPEPGIKIDARKVKRSSRNPPTQKKKGFISHTMSQATAQNSLLFFCFFFPVINCCFFFPVQKHWHVTFFSPKHRRHKH